MRPKRAHRSAGFIPLFCIKAIVSFYKVSKARYRKK